MGSTRRIWITITILCLQFFLTTIALWLFATGKYPQHQYPRFLEHKLSCEPSTLSRRFDCRNCVFGDSCCQVWVWYLRVAAICELGCAYLVRDV